MRNSGGPVRVRSVLRVSRRRQTAPRTAPRRRRTADGYWFASVCPMISCAVKLMPQVGKELPTKKLSDWSG